MVLAEVDVLVAVPALCGSGQAEEVQLRLVSQPILKAVV